MMRSRHALAALVAAGLLAACRDTIAPVPSDLSGTWTAGRLETGYTVDLTQTGTALSGSGTIYRNINPPTLALTATGSYSGGHVLLQLGAIDWFLDFDGRVVVRNDSTLMIGTATYMVGSPDTITFVKQPAP